MTFDRHDGSVHTTAPRIGESFLAALETIPVS